MNTNSQKIKILFLHAGAELYGADKILLELLEGIDRDKFEPVVLLPTDGPLVSKINELDIDVKVMHYPILRRKIFSALGILKYAIDYVKYSFKISKFVKKNKIDLTHVNTTAVLEGAVIKFWNKKPIVWHIHEIIESPKVVFQFTSLMVQVSSHQIITVSEATKKRLMDSPFVSGGKIETIYNGINTANVISVDQKKAKKDLQQKLNISNETVIVGMIGRINSWKGQSDFVEAMNSVMKSRSDVHAVIVGGIFEGEDYYLNELKKRIADSFDPSRIHLLGFNTKISDFYSLFDIFVLPSTQPDPFPTVILEAMANALPIIGYNHGGVTEMIEDNKSGFLVEVGQASELGEKILQLTRDQELSRSMGLEAEKRQRKLFSNDRFIDSFETKYIDLVNRTKQEKSK